LSVGRRVVIDEDRVEVFGVPDALVGTCREAGDQMLTWAMARLADQLHRSLDFRRAYNLHVDHRDRYPAAPQPTDYVVMGD
jgi:hypothetical protein